MDINWSLLSRDDMAKVLRLFGGSDPPKAKKADVYAAIQNRLLGALRG
jgi:hypothetical protein